MDLFTFNQRTKHGTLDFHPGIVYGFEDPDAVPYFKACGWGSKASKPDDESKIVKITIGELDIDPLTIWGDGPNKGKFVMPERVADHLGITDMDRIKGFVATDVRLENFQAQVEAELKGAQ